MDVQRDQINSWWEMISDAVGSLPWSAHVLFLIMLVAGVVLMLAGGKILRAAFILSGAMLGGAVGYFVPASFQLGFHPAITGVILAIAGVVLGATAFRATVAISLAASMAIIAPLLAFGVLSIFQPVGLEGSGSGGLSPDEMLLDGVREVGEAEWRAEFSKESDETSRTERAARAAAEQVGRFVRAAAKEMKYLWDRLPVATRAGVFWAAVLGPLAGFALGMAAPRRAGTLTTALIGSAMVLVAGWWLLLAAGVPIGEIPIGGPRVHTWAVIVLWLVLAATGVGIQWTRKRRPADKT